MKHKTVCTGFKKMLLFFWSMHKDYCRLVGVEFATDILYLKTVVNFDFCFRKKQKVNNCYTKLKDKNILS